MSTASATPAPPAATGTKRARKRIYIPVILLLLVGLVAAGFYARGTWADNAERNPGTPAEGTITQLMRKKNGNVVVRTAIVVDAPPKTVWAVVTGYDKHHEFLPYVSKVEATKQADGRTLIDGIAHSRLWGDWPFRSLVVHQEFPDEGRYSALWNEQDTGPFAVNRGGWSLSPVDNTNKQTVLVFTLQVELKDYPNAIVRNIIMDRLHSILKAMRDETLKRN